MEAIEKRATQEIAISNIDEKVKEYFTASLSKNTLKTYRACMKKYSLFCSTYNSEMFATETIVRYLTFLGETSKLATVKIHSSAILAFIKRIDQKKYRSIEIEQIETLLKGMKNTFVQIPEKKPSRANAIDADTIKIELRKPVETINDIRDRALIAIMYYGCLRQSELSGIRFEDLIFDKDGITIELPHTKTGDDQSTFVPATNLSYCPARFVAEYLQAVGITEGYLFRRLSIKGELFNEKGLSQTAIGSIFKKRLGTSKTHTMRVSFVTNSRKAGATNFNIMKNSRHKTSTMIDYYTRFEDAKKDNAANLLI